MPLRKQRECQLPNAFCPIRGVRCLSPHSRWRDRAWWPQQASPPLVPVESSAIRADARNGISLSRAGCIRVHEKEPGEIPPPCCMIETQPVRVIVFFGSKVLLVGRTLNGHVCIPDLKLVQLMSTTLPDAFQTHS